MLRPKLSRRVIEAVALPPLLLALSILPILRPVTDGPQQADAVVVLSGDYGERRAIAASLIEKGLVRTLVFVGTPDRAQEDELCQSRSSVEYICLRPQPDSTRNEARAVSQLAESRQWRTVIVATSTYHVTRSRLLFRRCMQGEIRLMGGDPPYGRAQLYRQVPEEWLKTIYTVVTGPNC